MNRYFLTFLFFICLISLQGKNRFQVNIPTVEQETEYIWGLIQDISFFEQYNYTLSLPEGALIDSLLVRAKTNRLPDSDFDQLARFMKDEIYNQEDYQKGYEKIQGQLGLLNQLVTQLYQTERHWIFKKFDQYQINLTLYGPGGSYNPEEGSILMYTTRAGQFKRYNDPINTLIHEVIHMGIEESIIQKYQVPHVMKEGIVDRFVWLNFHQELPDYRIQNMGETQLDNYLKELKDLIKLENIVQQLLAPK